MLVTVQVTIAGAGLPLQMRVEGGGQGVVHWKGLLGDSKVDEVDVSKRLSFVKCRLQILARGRPLDHSDLPSGCCKCRGLG